jgi:hypothetical protein
VSSTPNAQPKVTCQRPAPSGQLCKNTPVEGKLYCKGHCCSAVGCGASKSSASAGCPLHPSPSQEDFC